MLLLNLNKIRTAQERFEQVYEPGQFGTDPDFTVAARTRIVSRSRNGWCRRIIRLSFA